MAQHPHDERPSPGRAERTRAIPRDGARAMQGIRPATAVGAAALAFLVLVNALVLSSSNLIDDDAFIFFRYVDNMLRGHGLTWNPAGEHVEGYSSFLYVMALAPFRAFGADPVAAAHAINIALFLATVLVAFRLVARAAGEGGPRVLVAPLLLATSAQLGAYSRNGMESMLFAGMLLLAVGAHVHRSARPRAAVVSGALFGLATLARPEGILVYAVCAVFSIAGNRRRGGALITREDWLTFAGLAAVLVPHLVWRVAYYGDVVPNTFHAKVGFSMRQIGRGVQGLLSFLGTFRGAVVALSVLAWVVAPRDRLRNLLGAILLTWVAYVTFFLGLPNWTLWYTMPVDLFSLMTLGWAITAMLGRPLAGSADRITRRAEPAGAPAAARPARGRTPVVAALFFLLLSNAAPGIIRNIQSHKGFRFSFTDPPNAAIVNQFITIGKRLREIARPDDTVAVGACGAIPYYSGLVTVDVLGLNDRHIARQPVAEPGSDAFGHERGDGRYVMSKRPTFMIPLPILTQSPNPNHAGFEKSFIEIFELPEFKSDYEFRNVEIQPGRYFNYYKRKELGAGRDG
jgi:arabinofuranosyltransferase